MARSGNHGHLFIDDQAIAAAGNGNQLDPLVNLQRHQRAAILVMTRAGCFGAFDPGVAPADIHQLFVGQDVLFLLHQGFQAAAGRSRQRDAVPIFSVRQRAGTPIEF